MEKKKKHHFVSQFYLLLWAKTEEKLYTNIGSEIHPKTTKEIAAENYFYRIKSLNKNEFDLLTRENSLLPNIPTRNLLKTIIDAGLFFRLEEALPLSPGEIINLEARQANLVEEFYCVVEDCVSSAHKKLLNAEYSNIDIEEYNYIVRFMFNQLTRTQKAKNNIKREIAEILEGRGIDFNAYHIISSLILSERMTLAAIEKLSTLTILENETDLKFITNDCPVLNLKTPQDKNIQLYWPISPNKALLLEDSILHPQEQKNLKEQVLKDNLKSNYFIKSVKKISRNEVSDFNRKIWDNKNRNAFSVSEIELSHYQ
ncbi:DUF4238 domain-containing protein [Janthinobacterium sp. Mn2066]|uniref:DUF4238 domain-containing protein n=1 Tax=Janthinobacterium sp. Mn2066 TaxID=3395264 RepID=UPI003BD2DA67